MHSISSEALDLVAQNAPDFLAAVRKAAAVPTKKSSERMLRLSLAHFEDNPMLLYAGLVYARSQGVTLVFYPQSTAPEIQTETGM